MKKLQLREPQIRELSNSVVVDIRHERLASPEEVVMEYLKDHDRITNSVGRDLTNIGSENKMKRLFERLMSAGQIERIPELKGSATAYRKATRGDGVGARASNKRPTLWSRAEAEDETRQ